MSSQAVLRANWWWNKKSVENIKVDMAFTDYFTASYERAFLTSPIFAKYKPSPSSHTRKQMFLFPICIGWSSEVWQLLKKKSMWYNEQWYAPTKFAFTITLTRCHCEIQGGKSNHLDSGMEIQAREIQGENRKSLSFSFKWIER